MEFSIIVPVYNAEKYIENTIKSVLENTFSDFECILIDDGSTDGSLVICENYEKRDTRIKVIRSENKGVSSARNIGLRNALGTYVLFLDADDIFYKNTLLKWHQGIHEMDSLPDVVFANYDEINSENNKKPVIFPYENKILIEKNLDLCLEHLYGGEKMIGWAIWKQCWKTEIIHKNNIYFDETLIMNEDGNWVLDVLIHSSSFHAIMDSVYGYRVFSDTSITKTNYTYKQYLSSNKMYTRWYYFFKNEYQGSAKNAMTERLAESYTNASSCIWEIDKKERSKAIKVLKENEQILFDSKRKEHQILLKIYKVLGIHVYLASIYYARKLK